MDLGATIKRYRKRQHIIQYDFANQCGISQTYLSQIETNDKEPTLEVLRQIAKGLKLPLPILFFLSMDETDIPFEKREAYNIIGSCAKALINELIEI